MATWDDLALGAWDQLYTWDDPDRDIAIDVAYARGEITLDAPEMMVDWTGDSPTSGLVPTYVRDKFPKVIDASDSYNRSISSGIGATEQGDQYSIVAGSAADFNVSAGSLLITMGTATARRWQIPAVTPMHFDVTFKVTISAAPTGASGSVEHGIRMRFQDTSNFVDMRAFRNVNSNNVTVACRQYVGAVETVTSFVAIPNATVGSSVWMRFVGIGPTLYGYGWMDGDNVPTTPLVTLSNVTWYTPLGTGLAEFYAAPNASVTNLPLTMGLSSLTILDRSITKASSTPHPWAGWLSTTMQRFSEEPSLGVGVLRPEATNTVYAIVIDDVSEANFDVTVKVRAPQLFTGAKGVFVILARFQDTNNYLRFRLDFNTDQIMGYAYETWILGSGTVVASGLFPDLFHYTDRWINFRAQGVGPVVRIKAWMDGDRSDRDWTAYFTDNTFATTPGKSGWGGYLAAGNTNAYPAEFWVDEYVQGANSPLDIGQISVGLSLDDGLPSTVTNTSNIGVNESSTDLLGPIGTSPDIYFSQFRADMPLSDLPRDTAGVAITGQVLSANGMRAVRLFTGRMADIPLDDRSAKLEAVSAARLALSAPVQPPAVHGYYEGKEATWLVAYILFKAGLYVAPRPLDGCRLYLPLNGTTHAYIPDTNSGAAALSGVGFSAVNAGYFTTPKWMDGPFTAAPDLAIDQTGVRLLQSGPGTLAYPASFAPGDDFLSQTGYKGRIECWVKGDPTNVAASLNPSQTDLVTIRVRNSGSTRYAALIIDGSRKLRGQINDGFGTVVYPCVEIPTDGRWHFVAFAWDLAPSGGTARTIMDNTIKAYQSGITNSNLPVTDDIYCADFNIALSTCEIRFTSGTTAAKAGFANNINFSPDVVMRRSLLQFEAIAETAPREGFEMLSQLAQSELAQLGFDEQDRVQYLPLSYWGEADQQVVKEALSTATNLGRSFKLTSDVHKIFNQVTLAFKQTSVNENWVIGFQSSQLVQLFPGADVTLVAPLNAPAIEVRGLTLAVMSGSALAAAPPGVTNAINYITMNTASDGSGTYATSSDITATIIQWDPGKVTIQIRNNSGNILYLANNVSIPPIGVGVKQAVVADATVMAGNSRSIAQRGIRNLPLSLPMIQTQGNAGTIAQTLASFLAYPRATIVSDVWGDFRRKPGTLVSVSDVDNTGLNAMSFRLTGVSTVQDGASVQQAISAVQAWPVQKWGSGTWGSGIWGAS